MYFQLHQVCASALRCKTRNVEIGGVHAACPYISAAIEILRSNWSVVDIARIVGGKVYVTVR